ncbi:hypothetical protein TNCV_4710841 [Trichonephila clavipes]|uniref:Uncharacterized protein n=1 Tax=Trichonephila clavipes TaxID=2585209 RepID=A0A8X6RZM6_TRICX|nr:hypothetical protein TNCV_4710841 [Trichonephila clavipes]
MKLTQETGVRPNGRGSLEVPVSDPDGHVTSLSPSPLKTRRVGRWTVPPIAWSPRSSDLNLVDFFFWGHLKSLVYEMPVATVEDNTTRSVLRFSSHRQHSGFV